MNSNHNPPKKFLPWWKKSQALGAVGCSVLSFLMNKARNKIQDIISQLPNRIITNPIFFPSFFLSSQRGWNSQFQMGFLLYGVPKPSPRRAQSVFINKKHFYWFHFAMFHIPRNKSVWSPKRIIATRFGTIPRGYCVIPLGCLSLWVSKLVLFHGITWES